MGRIVCGGIVLVFLATALGAAAAPGEPAGAVLALEAYIAAVQEGHEGATRCLWSATYLADARALGVRYRDVICAWDLASPVTIDQRLGADTAYRAGLQSMDGGQGVLTATSVNRTEPATHQYGVVWEDGGWRLADRIWLAGRAWPERRTRYTILRGEGVADLDPAVCAALDDEIDRYARLLGVDDERLAFLAATGIPYYVTDDDTVARLTGYPTRGMANLASGSVISSDSPHFHELAHLVTNAVLQDLPLRTHPLLQEGLACRLGGRWGRAPATILYTGWFHLELDLVTVTELLTWDGFHGAAAGLDGSYAVAALMVDLVREQAGWAGVLRLYRDLSGPPGMLRSLTADDVARRVLDACGLVADNAVMALEAAVRVRAADWRRCGIAPGWEDTPFTEQRQFVGEAGTMAIQLHEGRWLVQVTTGVYPFLVTVDHPDGGSHGPGPGDSLTTSRLFAEQWPGRQRSGARWGLVCRPDNIGLYDYASNRLVATWVASFSGEDPLGSGGTGPLRFVVSVPPGLEDVPLSQLRLAMP